MATGYFDDAVIVFGAGASYDCKSDGSKNGAPLLLKLLTYYDANIQQTDPILATVIFNNSFDLIRSFFAHGDHVNSAADVNAVFDINGKNLEDVFSFIDMTLEMWEEREELGTICLNARNELIRIFTEIFWHVHNRFDKNYLVECDNYATIARLVSQSSKSTIVTFNWDCLFESVMYELSTNPDENWVSSSMRRWCFNQVADTTWSGHNIIDKTLSRLELDKLFIKLHGSISWHVCENSNCSLYGWAFLENQFGTPCQTNSPFEICKSCGKVMTRLIVPPTFRKNLTKYNAISKQWIMARRRLLNAKRVVFIGYSFPRTDLASDWLFRTMSLIPDLVVNVIAPEQNNARQNIIDTLTTIVQRSQIEDLDTPEENHSFTGYCRYLNSRIQLSI